jgi:hypothetical protein
MLRSSASPFAAATSGKLVATEVTRTLKCGGSGHGNRAVYAPGEVARSDIRQDLADLFSGQDIGHRLSLTPLEPSFGTEAGGAPFRLDQIVHVTLQSESPLGRKLLSILQNVQAPGQLVLGLLPQMLRDKDAEIVVQQEFPASLTQ